ncbi:hypothetical protein FACS189445_4690 [Spirochaetia bacterium]|nr:hypothetical protein FACS189445_4690 [Spirochaetia bacterium]
MNPPDRGSSGHSLDPGGYLITVPAGGKQPERKKRMDFSIFVERGEYEPAINSAFYGSDISDPRYFGEQLCAGEIPNKTLYGVLKQKQEDLPFRSAGCFYIGRAWWEKENDSAVFGDGNGGKLSIVALFKGDDPFADLSG